MPGSRGGEVSRLGPVFAAACDILTRQDASVAFVTPTANAKLKALFTEHLQRAGIADRFVILDGQAHAAIAAADVVLLASGTATLETALIGRPMVAAYRLAPLTYFIAKALRLVRIPFITLPNLLTAEPMVDEFVQAEANANALASSVARLLDDPQRRQEISSAFRDLYYQLALGADRNAAQAVLQLVRGDVG